MKSIKIFIIITLILLSIGIASAEPITIDDIWYKSSGSKSSTGGPTSSMWGGDGPQCFKLYTSDITALKGIQSSIWKLTDPGTTGKWFVYDSGIVTDEVSVVYKVGSTQVGTGIIQFNYLTTAEDVSYAVILFLFDNGIDGGALTGAQYITCEYTVSELNGYCNGGYYSKSYTGADVLLYPVSATSNSYRYIKAVEGIYYYAIDFSQSLTYDYDGDTSIYISYDRNDFTNYVSITGDSGIPLYTKEHQDNLYFTSLYDFPYTVIIDNPYTDEEPFANWTYIIPEEIEVETEEETLLKLYVYDGTNNALVSSHQTSIAYGSGKYQNGTYLGGASTHIINWTDESATANMTINSEGYTSEYQLLTPSSVSTEGWWMQEGTTHTLMTTLYPIAGINATTFDVTFNVQEEIYADSDKWFFATDAYVTFNGTTQKTGAFGGTTFSDLPNGTYIYTVKKSGCMDVMGSVTIDGANEQVSPKLYKIESIVTPTPTPTPTSTITTPTGQPTNIIESLYYAFGNIFGWSTENTEELSNIKLVLAVIVIFGGASLLASITKSGLGAIVGAIIGFVAALGFGLLPIWLFFVGFCCCAIYFVFSKANGD